MCALHFFQLVHMFENFHNKILEKKQILFAMRIHLQSKSLAYHTSAPSNQTRNSEAAIASKHFKIEKIESQGRSVTCLKPYI